MSDHVFHCGPVSIAVHAPSAPLYRKVAEQLGLYTVPWEPPYLAIHLLVRDITEPAEDRAGDYLQCVRMRVDATAAGLRATCESGAAAAYTAASRSWCIGVPPRADGAAVPDDVEDLIGLVLATAWREAGWVPLHAGAVVRKGCCALLTAPSGGGKTTLTAAFVRRGWQTLGDDKLLVRVGADAVPEARALVHHCNLHPLTRRWFPEVGDLERLPRYSASTEKRKVHIDDIWPARTLTRGRPTHVVHIAASADARRLSATRLDATEILATLLRSTVIPNQPAPARPLLVTLAAVAKQLDGWRVDVGPDAYAEPDCLEPIEAVLRGRG